MSDSGEIPASAGPRLRALMVPLSAPGAALGDSPLLVELGRVIGLADAIQLHGLLQDKKPAVGAAQSDSSGQLTAAEAEDMAAQVRADVIHTRQALLDTLAEACGERGGDGFLRWPNLELAVGLDGLTPAQRLERFYSRLQQTLQVRVQELRQRTRLCLRPVLPQLIELDTWLEQALVPHLERGLATIPRQLGRHCAEALAAADVASNPDEKRGPASSAWQDELRLMTCRLFIAETDVRLEPILGLVEALEDKALEDNQRKD